jgi:hypothetical protein
LGPCGARNSRATPPPSDPKSTGTADERPAPARDEGQGATVLPRVGTTGKAGARGFRDCQCILQDSGSACRLTRSCSVPRMLCVKFCSGIRVVRVTTTGAERRWADTKLRKERPRLHAGAFRQPKGEASLGVLLGSSAVPTEHPCAKEQPLRSLTCVLCEVLFPCKIMS